jgi:16S rRNA (adenine1518-N6/adenine1519-N6)-dimethyltransferase
VPAGWRQEPFKVIANIPYYITSPIIFQLLDWHKLGYGVSTAILMVQEEVAERLAAGPGGREYGVITIMLQLYAQVEMLVKIPAAKFFPVPKVNSALIRITFLPAPRVALSHTETFTKIVKASFAQRRKTIYNSLKNNYGVEENLIADCLLAAGIDARRRAETLSIEEFATLSEVIHAKQKSNV